MSILFPKPGACRNVDSPALLPLTGEAVEWRILYELGEFCASMSKMEKKSKGRGAKRKKKKMKSETKVQKK